MIKLTVNSGMSEQKMSKVFEAGFRNAWVETYVNWGSWCGMPMLEDWITIAQVVTGADRLVNPDFSTFDPRTKEKHSKFTPPDEYDI